MEKEKKEEKTVKRGRRPKNEKRGYFLNRDQTKFFVDLSNDSKSLEIIFDLLAKANQKDFGREVIFKDLALMAVSKLTDKDIEKLKEASLNEMERVERALVEYNRKNEKSLSMGEFLIKRLGI